MRSRTRLRYNSVPHISQDQIERIQFPSIHNNLEQLEEPKQTQISKEHQQNNSSQQQQSSLKELSTGVDFSQSQLVTLQQLQQYQQPQHKSNVTSSAPTINHLNPTSHRSQDDKIETRRQISKSKFEEQQRKIFDQHLNHMQKSIDFASLFQSTNHNDHFKSTQQLNQHQETQQQSHQQQSSLFSSLTPALKQTVNTRFTKEVANYNGKKQQVMNKLRKPWGKQSGSQTMSNPFEQPQQPQESDDQTINSSNRFLARKNQQSLLSKRNEATPPQKPFESLLLKNGEEDNGIADQHKHKSKLRGIRQYSEESEQSQTPIVLLKLGNDNSGQDSSRFKHQDTKPLGNNLTINLNNNNDINKPKPRRQLRRGLPYLSFEDTYTQLGQLCTNCTDKFEFFRYVPVGCMITLTKKYLKDEQKDSRGKKISSKVMDDQECRSLFASSPSPRINEHPSSKQQNNKPKKNVKNGSPANNQSKSDYLSILAKQEEISRAAREAQIGKFCVMSKRMSIFFNEADNPYNSTSTVAEIPSKPPSSDQVNHNAHHACTNIELFEKFSEQCREFFRCMQLLFNLDKNRNKNINFLFRLIANKTYLSSEVLDIQFRLVNMAAVQTLENSLINENIIKNYFPQNQTLFSIMEDIYMKDLIYINSSFQEYLNKQQLSLAGKMSSTIQQEYQMVKQKEKDIILDKLENNGSSNSINGILLLNSRAAKIKKSYTFFNSYLYNIQPRRNTYKEIEEFEKLYGQFSHLNQIDRDIFMNLEKSFEEIRASNKE